MNWLSRDYGLIRLSVLDCWRSTRSGMWPVFEKGGRSLCLIVRFWPAAADHFRQVTPFFGLASEATCFVVPFRASRRTAVGLAGYAPRLVPSRGHSALIPDVSGP